jgi:hypothetical protein
LAFKISAPLPVKSECAQLKFGTTSTSTPSSYEIERPQYFYERHWNGIGIEKIITKLIHFNLTV